jgi:hypothetical protein
MTHHATTHAPQATATTTNIASGILQRKCACGTHTVAGGACESCGKEKVSGNLQRAAKSAEPINEAPPIVHEVLRSAGQPLEAGARSFFEPRFKHDFSRVRVHTDARAVESARSVNALAYTVGRNIVFGAGQYRHDLSGAYLLAHELAHVTQNDPARHQASTLQAFAGGGQQDETLRLDNPPSSRAEQQADRMARAVVTGRAISEAPMQATGIHRQTPIQATGVHQHALEGSTQLPAKKDAPKVDLLADLLIEWRNAGLLDPPFRPSTVEAIPLPEALESKAEKGKNQALIMASAARGSKPKTPLEEKLKKENGTRPLTTDPQPGSPEEETIKPESWIAKLLGFLWRGATLTAGFLLMSANSGEGLGAVPQRQLQPFNDPLQLKAIAEGMEEWYWQLSFKQTDYLSWLYHARTLEPDPVLEFEPELESLLASLPEPPSKTPSKKEQKPCFSTPIKRLGSPRGSAYATKVSGSTEDYFVRASPIKGTLELAYDGLTPPSIVWEAKAGYGWFFNPKKASLVKIKLAEFDAQKDLGMTVAKACGYSHKWSVSDNSVARMLNERWGGSPPVLSIPEKL